MLFPPGCLREARSWHSTWLCFFVASYLSGLLGRCSVAAKQFANCNPTLNPPKLDPPYVYSLEPVVIGNCDEIKVLDYLALNLEIVAITHINLTELGPELVLLVDKAGSVHQLFLYSTTDPSHGAYRVDTAIPPRKLRGSGCLDPTALCSASSALAIPEGFLAVDRHRLQKFLWDWTPTEGVQKPHDILNASYGQMNGESEINVMSGLLFPTSVAEYRPHNSTFLSYMEGVGPSYMNYQMTPLLLKHAPHRLFIVTDTGHQRIVLLGETATGLEYVGQFGVTDLACNDTHGFNNPWTAVVQTPAWEVNFEPIFANVYVTDRGNNRLVKLNLGHPKMQYPLRRGCPMSNGCSLTPDCLSDSARRYDKPYLAFSGEYGQAPEVSRGDLGLFDPVSVSLYRHYVLVGEARGNVITVLQVNHRKTSELVHVTELRPATGTTLMGVMAASPFGFVWYTYHRKETGYMIASVQLPIELRFSLRPDIWDDFLDQCVNESWFNETLMQDPVLFWDYVTEKINASQYVLEVNDSRYLDPLKFNKSGVFDFQRFNKTFYVPKGKELRYCEKPPPPTAFPMAAGSPDGWVKDKKNGSKIGSACRQHGQTMVAAVFMLVVGVLLVLVS